MRTILQSYCETSLVETCQNVKYSTVTNEAIRDETPDIRNYLVEWAV